MVEKLIWMVVLCLAGWVVGFTTCATQNLQRELHHDACPCGAACECRDCCCKGM